MNLVGGGAKVYIFYGRRHVRQYVRTPNGYKAGSKITFTRSESGKKIAKLASQQSRSKKPKLKKQRFWQKNRPWSPPEHDLLEKPVKGLRKLINKPPRSVTWQQVFEAELHDHKYKSFHCGVLDHVFYVPCHKNQTGDLLHQFETVLYHKNNAEPDNGLREIRLFQFRSDAMESIAKSQDKYEIVPKTFRELLDIAYCHDKSPGLRFIQNGYCERGKTAPRSLSFDPSRVVQLFRNSAHSFDSSPSEFEFGDKPLHSYYVTPEQLKAIIEVADMNDNWLEKNGVEIKMQAVDGKRQLVVELIARDNLPEEFIEAKKEVMEAQVKEAMMVDVLNNSGISRQLSDLVVRIRYSNLVIDRDAMDAALERILEFESN